MLFGVAKLRTCLQGQKLFGRDALLNSPWSLISDCRPPRPAVRSGRGHAYCCRAESAFIVGLGLD